MDGVLSDDEEEDGIFSKISIRSALDYTTYLGRKRSTRRVDKRSLSFV